MSRELLVLLISVQSQQFLPFSQWRANLDRVDLTDQRGDLVPPLTLHRRSLAAGCVLEIEGAQLGQLDVLDQPRRDALQCIDFGRIRSNPMREVAPDFRTVL